MPINRPPVSPLTAFSCIWLVVLMLYSLKISILQTYSTPHILSVISLIVFPFAFFFTLGNVLISKLPRLSLDPTKQKADSPARLAKTTRRCSVLFITIILFEILAEGYIPLLSMVTGQNISHFEFGISSLHGFCLALGALNTTLIFYIYIQSKSKEQLLLLSAHFLIFALIVTRKMIVISLVQMLFVYLCVGKQQISRKPIPIFVAAISGLLAFGWIGDARTGRELFLSLANLTFVYPDWLPSGVICVYMYCITPILNLTNAIQLPTQFSYDLQFICSTVPSVIRPSLGCVANIGFDNEYQVSGAFNIATGYISIYNGWGLAGVALFSGLHGVGASYIVSRYRQQAKHVLLYSLFMQITTLLIFSNGFFNLNVMAQFFVLPLLFIRVKRNKAQSRILVKKTRSLY